jgi:hypothetical protein
VAELRSRRVFPASGTHTFTTEEGGLALQVEETVSDTANPTIRQVNLAIADARDKDRVLTRLTAYVSR